MRNQDGPTHFNWRSIYETIKLLPEEKAPVSEFDNDAVTLEKERSRFQSMLSTLSPRIRVDHLEQDKQGRDLFVLTAESLDFLTGIRNLFKDSGVQYDIDVGVYNTPIKGNDTSSMRPLQNTAVISRLPLRKLKGSLFLTLLACVFSIVGVAYFSLAFYRVVFI